MLQRHRGRHIDGHVADQRHYGAGLISDSDGATVTGNAAGGSPTGTVSFYVCGADGLPTPCTSLADPIGTAVTVTTGAGHTSSAASGSFTPTATGFWCFAAYYSGDTNYNASTDATTDECFDVPAARTTTVTVPDQPDHHPRPVRQRLGHGDGQRRWRQSHRNGDLLPVRTGLGCGTVHLHLRQGGPADRPQPRVG